MSETGVYAGRYQRVRDYAESVDRLLLELKSGQHPTEATLKPVLSLLKALENAQEVSAGVQVVSMLLRAKNALPMSRIKTVRSELTGDHPSLSTIAALETFASLLDEERAAIAARLRGV
jgi:hypothetical protein